MSRFTKTSENAFENLPELRRGGNKESKNNKELSVLPGLSRAVSQGFPKLGREINNYVQDQIEPHSEKNLSREISKGISYLDIVSRVRDIEKKYVDLASSMDRRIQSFIEENPQKVMRHIKTLEDKESTLWKESQNKQVAMQEGLDTVKYSMRENTEGVNQLLVSVSRRLDDSEYKIANILRGLESLNIHKNEGILAIADRPYDHEQKMGTLEGEVRILKEALNQERQRRDTLFQDIMMQYQEITGKVYQNENELLTRMKKHKDDVVEENKRTKDQQKKLEELKLEKLLNDSGYLRSLIRQVESKVEEEVNKRLKHEFENKNWMEQKMALFKQDLKTDEKSILENEKRFFQNIQESMASLNLIVVNTKEQLEANLAATQTLFSENVKSLSKTVDLLKNNVYTKLNAFDTTVKDLDQRFDDVQKGFHDHTISVNETMEKEFGRIEKVTLKFEELMNDNFKLQDEKLNLFDENNKLWKKGFEDKNLRVLTEISNALKTLKGDLNKEKTATHERFENVKNEISSHQAANDKLFNQLNDRVKASETQYEYRLDETFVKASENLRHAVDKLNQEITKNGSSTLEKAKKDAQSNLNALEKKLQGYTDSEIVRAKEEVTKNHRNELDGFRNEVSKDFQAVHLKTLDMQNQRASDKKELQDEIKYLHDRVTEVNDETRGAIRQLSDDMDGKFKLANLNSKNFTNEKVKDLQQETNKSLAAQREFVSSEVGLAKAQNEKLVSDLHEKIKDEIATEKADLKKQCDNLLEEERRVRALKDTENLNAIESNKKMLLETISTKIESTQALARALVSEEAAERARGIDGLTKTFKTRLDAFEKYFKELISTSVEEAKLELKELLRNLDIKMDKHKIWTVTELNSMITDLDEYMICNTAYQYREELYAKVNVNERSDQWKQIEEAFQVVGAKFEELDVQRREDAENVDKKLSDLEEVNNQDHDAIEAKINEVHDQVKQETQQIHVQLDDHGKAIQALQKETEDLQGELYQVDEKFTNGLEDVGIKIQVKEYVDFLYSKAQSNIAQGEDDDLRKEMKRKFKRVDEQMVLIDERFDENEKSLELFEQKTENNFKIAEKALLAHRDYLNNLDSRLTVEEMISEVIQKRLEDTVHNELMTVTTQVDLLHEDVEAKLNDRFERYQKRLEEDEINISKVIPHHILNVEDKLKNFKQEVKTGDTQSKDQYQQKISEHEIMLHKHQEMLDKYNQSIAEGSGMSNEVKAAIMHDVQKSLDNDIHTMMEKNMQILIEKDISKMIERETNKKMSPFDERLKNVESKAGKGGSVNSLDKGQEDEIKKELVKFKEIIDKIQKEMNDKDKANSAIEKKMESLNTNVANIEKTVKGEIDKTYTSQNENHKATSQQLNKLFEQFQNLQEKIVKH